MHSPAYMHTAAQIKKKLATDPRQNPSKGLGRAERGGFFKHSRAASKK